MRTTRGGPDGQGDNGPVIVEAPDDVDVRIQAAPNRGAGDARRRRDFGAADGGPQAEDALIQGLNASVDSTIVADVRLSLPPEQRFRKTIAEPTRLRVQVASNEDAAVLMQSEDGVFTWVYPDQGPADGTPPERRALREVTFTLTAVDNTPNPSRGFPDPGAIGGWLVDKLTKPVRAIVLTFAADIAIEVLIRRIEGGNKIGLVVLDDLDPKRWMTADPPAALPSNLFDGQPKRVLLLVHGTFSNTRGSFGQLTAYGEGKKFLQAAYAYYDAVLGFDHKTLADSVETNVAQIKAVLAALPAGTVVDAVAYSRGGLVYRVLAEEALPDLAWRKAVFVGCTNAGTHLASPENWRALADIYTNVIMAGAKFTATLVGGGALNPLIELGIKSLGEFVTILPRRAVVEGHVPGLASMDPDGDTVRRLNTATATTSARAYYAISSDFEPGLDFGRGVGPALSRVLLDKVTDDLWKKAANDLVVDTKSMDNVGGRQAWMGQVNAYPQGGDCYHTIYFSLDKTARQLSEWLITPDEDAPESLEAMAQGVPDGGEPEAGDDGAAAAADDAASGDPPRDGGFAPERARFDSLDFGLAPAGPPRPRIDASISPGQERHAPPSTAAAPPAEGTMAQDRIAFNAAASMPQSPVAGSWAPLTVTLSQEAIAAIAGHAQAHAGVEADPAQLLRLILRARANCVLGETTEAVVEAPAAGAPVERIFQIKGSAPGPGEVWVEITQRADTLQRLVLQPEFAEAATASATAVVTGASNMLPMIDLRVWEERIDEGARLRFLVRSNELGLDIEAFTTLGAVDRVTYVAQLYKALENTWRPAGANFNASTQQIINRGADLYRKLFPLKVQRALWKHRKQIGSIQVFSYAPTIPWEVCFLTQPPKEDDGDGPADSPSPSLEDGGRFLAEFGLTRWLSNIGIAPARLSLRPGKALYCIPNYEPGLRLANLQKEAEMLADTLGAKAISPHIEPVLDVLRGDAGEDFDVLHFAGHGQADGGAIWNSALLLEGEGTATSPIREALGVSDLGMARLTVGGRRPIVFLNACQAGTGGNTLGGSTGLAQILVERGAGLLVSALWSVSDATASMFAKTFYTQLQAGLTVTEAVRDARQAAKASTPQDFTWLAYTVFGHPYARVTP